MKPEDIKRMDEFFATHSYDKEGDIEHGEATLDPDDAEAAGVAYFTEDGELLLLRRGERTDSSGTWAFPAGMLEDDDADAEAAARREFLEETGTECPPLAGSSSYTDDNGLTFTCFAVHGPKFNPHMNDEHNAFTWATPDDLPQPLHPGVIKALRGLPTTAEV